MKQNMLRVLVWAQARSLEGETDKFSITFNQMSNVPWLPMPLCENVTCYDTFTLHDTGISLNIVEEKWVGLLALVQMAT